MESPSSMRLPLTRRFLNNTNINKIKKKPRKYREAEDIRHMTIKDNRFNPIINVYIYEVASNKLPDIHNNFQLYYSFERGQQKFGNLYHDTQSKGIIYPKKYHYYVPNPDSNNPDSYNPAHLNSKYKRKHIFNINQVENDGRLYTSDILSSVPQQGGSINNLKDFYYFYKSHRTKKVDFQNNDTRKFYTSDRINDIIKTIIKAIIQTKKIHEIDEDYNCQLYNNSNEIEKRMINENDIYDERRLDEGFIYNIHLNKNDKVIIFGDFHGSFHTFYRNFLRLHLLGIIDFQNYIINDGYKIIFLGDIADRGQYALEIYYIICKFICVNNNDPNNLKIVLNRGNHEEPSQWRLEDAPLKAFGFTSELTRKIKDRNQHKIILTYMKRLLSYSSTGIVLTYHDYSNTHRYWLSHGGIPVKKEGLLSKVLKLNNDRCMSIDYYYSTTIRWADYNPEIAVTTFDGRPNICNSDLYKFLKLNNIDFIIRGHTDNNENAFLLSNSHSTNAALSPLAYKHVYPLNQINIYDINPECRNIKNKSNKIIFPPSNKIVNNPLINNINQINGPITQIRTKGWYNKKIQNNFLVSMRDTEGNPSIYATNQGRSLDFVQHQYDINVYPVLTISTNSDTGRSLNKDSFIILNMNNDDDGTMRPNSSVNNLMSDLRNHDYENLEEFKYF